MFCVSYNCVIPLISKSCFCVVLIDRKKEREVKYNMSKIINSFHVNITLALGCSTESSVPCPEVMVCYTIIWYRRTAELYQNGKFVTRIIMLYCILS